MSEKKYTAEEMADAYLQKRQAEEAAKERKRRERFEKESARKAWVHDGGAEGDFERRWPGMRDEARARRVADADRRAREAQRARMRSAFWEPRYPVRLRQPPGPGAGTERSSGGMTGYEPVSGRRASACAPTPR